MITVILNIFLFTHLFFKTYSEYSVVDNETFLASFDNKVKAIWSPNDEIQFCLVFFPLPYIKTIKSKKGEALLLARVISHIFSVNNATM